MPAWLPAAVAGVASLIGGERGNRAGRKEADRNRKFQERMSSTSWQRGVSDMREAGLNPALAYSQGGASSPGGSMAPQQDTVTPAIGSAMQKQRLEKEIKLLEEQARQVYNDSMLKRNQAEESAYRRELISHQQDAQLLNNQHLELQLPWMRASAKAINTFPQAAMMQLLLNSGGSQLMGLGAGALGLKAFRGGGKRR